MFNLKALTPGLRIIKTTFAIGLCLVIFYSFSYYKPIYAAMACILTMKETSSLTLSSGINRMIGTVIGGVVALLGLYFIKLIHISSTSLLMSLIITAFTFFVLVLCKLFKFDSYVYSMAAVITVFMMLSYNNQGNALDYVMIRVFETFVGIVMAYLVNQYFNFGKKNNQKI